MNKKELARKYANLRTEVAEEGVSSCCQLTVFSELPEKQLAGTLRQSRLVISPPVSLGNDTSTHKRFSTLP